METKDLVTLLIAGWGAILSTVLAFREFFRERRNIRITLFRINWMDAHKISITNTGHRPITIREVGISLGIKGKGPKFAEPVRSSALFADIGDYKPPGLPLILTDGQTVEFYLSEYVGGRLDDKYLEGRKMGDGDKLFIYVYDSEGRVYTKYDQAVHDPKYAQMTKK